MNVMALGMQKLRDGFGNKFYVAVLRDLDGSRRYGLRRFSTATEALAYARKVEGRWKRMAKAAERLTPTLALPLKGEGMTSTPALPRLASELNGEGEGGVR